MVLAAPPRGPHTLGRYTDGGGRRREVVCQPGAGGSLLVVDRDAVTRGEPRLLAHLGADEPPGNAALVCAHFLSRGGVARCRELRAEDLREPPFADTSSQRLDPRTRVTLRAGEGSLSLRLLDTGMSIPELRWCIARGGPDGTVAGRPRPISLRDAVAELESYEPPCALTRAALACLAGDPGVSTATLAVELERVLRSAIVLNRGLREAVLERVRRGSVSMSEIAVRCGRVKRDRNGRSSGETSWLARRLGLMPDGSGSRSRWIHSDVLALIARQGLGIAPREVEL